MKFVVLSNMNRSRAEINIITLSILLFIFRTANPLFKYPFIILYFYIILYFIFYRKKRVIDEFKNFVSNYFLILLVLLILFIAFSFSDKLYLTIFKDGFSALILMSLFYLLSSIISSKEEFRHFLENVLRFTVFFAFVISICNILDLFDIISLHKYFFTNDISGNYPNYSQMVDYNFALLPVIFGLIIIFHLLPRTSSYLKKIIFFILLTVLSLNIFFSGSKRGAIIFIGIFFILAIAQFVYLFKKKQFLKDLAINFRFLFSSLFLLSLLSFIFLVLFSATLRLNTLKFIGSKNTLTARIKIASSVLRYVSIFDKEILYPDLYEKIWSISLFDPKEPDSGWGTRVHKSVFPLTGNNVKIVPPGTKGYLMDSTCNPSSWDGNSFSFTKFGTKDLAQGKFGKAFVYSYVSGDFNGTWVLLSLESRKGFIECTYYDLNKKDTWQKLEVVVKKNKENLNLNMYFSEMGVTDFSKLKGYVIFAYPKFEYFENGDSLTMSNSSDENSLKDSDYTNNFLMLWNSTHCDTLKNTNSQQSNLVFNQSPEDRNGSVLEKNGVIDIWQNGPINNIAGLFNFNIHSNNTMFSSSGDRDPLRKWISVIISEDTVYHPYKANISVDTLSKNFINLRVSHWKFACQIFSKEFNFSKKLFGGGFNFLNWYGYYFIRDKTASDWPHNPFLSILLYSGIFGLLIYFYLLYKVFFFYLKYLKEYYLFFIFFMVTFFFQFFSGSSPFDPSVIGFFTILPFFIDYIHRKDDEDLTRKNIKI